MTSDLHYPEDNGTAGSSGENRNFYGGTRNTSGEDQNTNGGNTYGSGTFGGSAYGSSTYGTDTSGDDLRNQNLSDGYENTGTSGDWEYRVNQIPRTQERSYVYGNGNGAPSRKRKSGRGWMYLLGFITGIVLAVIVFVGIAAYARYRGSRATSDINSKILTFQKMINESFLFDSDVDYNDGMLRGYIEALNDPYSVYYNEEEYAKLKESSSGTYSGIGVMVQQDPATGYVNVIKVFEGSPAKEAGMQKDDIIWKVRGEDVAGMDLNLIVAEIKGQEHTTVDLTVYRPSEQAYIDMTVERRKISVETVSHKMLENNTGYIEVTSFDEVTAGQFIEAFEDLKAQGMKAVIVDLRDNGGGLLSSVTAMLDYLLPEGVLTYTEDKNGTRQYIRSDEAAALDVPMAVLVNGNSASASELFTEAVRDYEVAVVVGTKSFGKGIVQTIYSLGDGTALKLTTSRYYSPNGICIHGDGIIPDYVVEAGTDPETDPQLDKALEVLSGGAG